MKTIWKLLQIALPVAAVVLLVVQVVVSNELGKLGNRMGQLDMAVNDQRSSHEILQAEVASASALMTIRDKAVALGFHDPAQNQIIALTPQVPVAFGVNSRQPVQPLQ